MDHINPRPPPLSPPQALAVGPVGGIPQPQPIPEAPQDFARRYAALAGALEVAVRKGSNKLTYEDFQLALPLQCALNPNEARDAWIQTGEELRMRVLAVAHQKLDEARTAEGLRAVQQAVQHAKERALAGDGTIRGDEWVHTNNLTPAAISATYNLPVYDSEFTRLQEELSVLSTDIAALSGTLRFSEAQRVALESQYQTELSDLDKVRSRSMATRQAHNTVSVDQSFVWQAIAGLQVLPVDEMTLWMESTLSKDASKP